LNKWTSGSGAFLSRDHVKAAISTDLKQEFQGEPGQLYFLALDLGLKRDKTVIAVVHKDPDSGLVILDHLRTFIPPSGGEIFIEDVEEAILQLSSSFPLQKVVFDPWQSVRTRQRLEERGLRIEEFTFSGTNLTKLTQNLFGLFRDRRIKIFPHRELTKELLSVQVVEKSYGYRIDHQSGSHDDHVIALGMAALAAMQTKAASGPILFGWLDGNMNFEPAAFTEQAEQQNHQDIRDEQTGPPRPQRIRP
jgi:phage terminase large subunit-like protein